MENGAGQDIVVSNVFKDKNGKTQRQFVVEADRSVVCSLCASCSRWTDLEATRNAFYALKSHGGNFLSVRNNPEARTHLMVLMERHEGTIVVPGVPSKTNGARLVMGDQEPCKMRKRGAAGTLRGLGEGAVKDEPPRESLSPPAEKKTRRLVGGASTSVQPAKLIQFKALKQIHPDLVRAGCLSSRAFPRHRGIMPSFELENVDGAIIRSEAHEAFEQFVVAWIFNEIVPRYLFQSKSARQLRVLELGGGIGAVSTMVQQMIEMLDPSAPHVVFEPNDRLVDGPLMANRERYGSRFEVFRGVLSKSPEVALHTGNIDPKHPRAWMWGTVAESKASPLTNCSRKLRKVKGIPLEDVVDYLGGPPTVLIADCEGGLIPVLVDYPEILDSACTVYYERDPPGDYASMEKLLVVKGFSLTLRANMHRVWVREAAFDDDSDIRVQDEAHHAHATGRPTSTNTLARVSTASPEWIDRRMAEAVASQSANALQISKLKGLMSMIDTLIDHAKDVGEPDVAAAISSGARAACEKRMSETARAHVKPSGVRSRGQLLSRAECDCGAGVLKVFGGRDSNIWRARRKATAPRGKRARGVSVGRRRKCGVVPRPGRSITNNRRRLQRLVR